MNQTTMFRLKVQYKRENQETGEVEKVKTEILAECFNYTDAEAVLMKIAGNEQMNKLEQCAYDIVRTKFTPADIVGGEPMQCDESSLVCGLVEHFFELDSEGLYAVDTIVFGDKSQKEKDIKRTYYLTASDVADAMRRAKQILCSQGNDLSNCAIPSAKIDNASMVYLLPQTSGTIYKEATKIFY